MKLCPASTWAIFLLYQGWANLSSRYKIKLVDLWCLERKKLAIIASPQCETATISFKQTEYRTKTKGGLEDCKSYNRFVAVEYIYASGNLLHKYFRAILQLQQHELAYWSLSQIAHTPQVCFSLMDSNMFNLIGTITTPSIPFAGLKITLVKDSRRPRWRQKVTVEKDPGSVFHDAENDSRARWEG